MWFKNETGRFLIAKNMSLEELRKKVIYQNSIEIWIGVCKEKNIAWHQIENYKKFISYLLKNNLKMTRISICFDESDNSFDGGKSKKGFANALAGSKDENSACYTIKLNDVNIELIRKFSL